MVKENKHTHTGMIFAFTMHKSRSSTKHIHVYCQQCAYKIELQAKNE